MHEAGLVHGDVTLWNILLDWHERKAVLCDFGLSKRRGERRADEDEWGTRGTTFWRDRRLLDADI